MKVTYEKATHVVAIDCTDECSPADANTGPWSVLRGNEWRCFALAMCKLGKLNVTPVDMFNNVSLRFNDRTRSILVTVELVPIGISAKITLRYDGSR